MTYAEDIQYTFSDIMLFIFKVLDKMTLAKTFYQLFRKT